MHPVHSAHHAGRGVSESRRPLRPGAATGASAEGVNHKVYATIQGGASADKLTGVTVDSDLAASAELVPASPVDLPATTTVNLDENSTYIELKDLAAPLEFNRSFEMTMEFENAPDQRIQGAVRDPADPAT